MKLHCPYCAQEQEFTSGKPPFWTFSLMDARRERGRAARTVVCTQCGTEITFPKGTQINQD